MINLNTRFAILKFINTPSKPSPCVGIRTCSDYSPFGVELDGRTVSVRYRFGYQGSEKDKEFKGDGNSYTTEFRQLDPRLGRWLSVEPRASKYAYSSPFVLFGNSPILLTDSDGDTIRLAGSIQQQWSTLAFLQTLTNDKLTLINGTVYIQKVGSANPNKDLPNGTSLIYELVSHKKNLVIGQNSNNFNYTAIYENPESFDVIHVKNASNGVGLDAVVYIDLTKTNETVLLIEDPITHKSVWKRTARESTLAHELIHGLYILNGKNIQKGKGGVFETYIYKDENNKSVTTTEWKEETDTVGLTGNRKYTEYKIREEQGWGKRVKY